MDEQIVVAGALIYEGALLVAQRERPPELAGLWELPGGKVAFDLTADEPGDWAFHCHLLFHMHAGMFNVVTVRPLDGGAA